MIIRIILFSFLLLGFSCEDDMVDLPPMTEEGKNTIGWRANGKTYSLDNSEIVAQYSYSSIGSEIGWQFSVCAISNEDCGPAAICISADSVKIENTGTYILQEKSNGTFTIKYEVDRECEDWLYYTTNNVIGELKLTKWDLSRKIASGTFWANVVNVEGDIVEIRDGRFDVIVR